ncbi:hypothetical protein [Paludifilum halophilum]|uniref:hypothetical protein n=1 Tax=Paludifilum halophilum TaxID=1642702 RepID=UPI0011402FAF|nr:hypothetical protein [Paludifilum halophilum]
MKKVKIGNRLFTFINWLEVQNRSTPLPPIAAPAVVFLGAPINLRATFNLRAGEFVTLSAGGFTRNVFCLNPGIFVGSQRLRFFGDFVVVNCPTS